MLLCFVFFRKVSLFWEGSLEKWISYNPKEGRNRYAAPLKLTSCWNQPEPAGRRGAVGALLNFGTGRRARGENLKHIFGLRPDMWNLCRDCFLFIWLRWGSGVSTLSPLPSLPQGRGGVH